MGKKQVTQNNNHVAHEEIGDCNNHERDAEKILTSSYHFA